ncbi:hypothetical protein AB0O82_10725 [Kitasatospora sp. NPDC088264]|uniref:hypothetical protein n=1 Tax=Kitasatospora sp. NPDC088264 TaxID=3155296 RepID=UPI003445EDDC
MDQSTSTSRVRISPDGVVARIEVDGVDVSRDVRAYSLQQQAGELPELALLIAPHHIDRWEGAARVVIGEEPEPGPAAAAFLAALDAGELERAVLDRHDLMTEGAHEFTAALLVQLTEWALGKRNAGEVTD